MLKILIINCSRTKDGPFVWLSRRGKLHENNATFREDAFEIDTTGGWVLVAVADGAGSHYLSRVGSNLAVKACIDTLRTQMEKYSPDDSHLDTALRRH